MLPSSEMKTSSALRVALFLAALATPSRAEEMARKIPFTLVGSGGVGSAG